MGRRLVVGAVVAIVGGVLVVGGLVFWALRAGLPVVDGTAVLAGLGAPVTVVRDRTGVPHIFADSARDAVRALGFVQGQDRRLQMELVRRAATGRLAEIGGAGSPTDAPLFVGLFGRRVLDIDRQLRALGLGRLAAEELAMLDPEDRALFEAYAEGVNAATALYGVVSVPSLLPVPSEPWTAADSVATLKLITLMFANQRHEKLLAGKLLREVGERGLADFLPPYPDDAGSVLVDADPRGPAGGAAPAAAAAAAGLALDIPDPLAEAQAVLGFAVPMRASNNWVIHGSRSATGAPILANDPHGELALPGSYAVHVSAPGFEMIGIAGFGPAFISGHNRHIAWGVTVVNPDSQDLFVEAIRDGDPPEVRVPGGWERLRVRREEIAVLESAPVVEVVRESRHGPLIADLDAAAVRAAIGEEPEPGTRYALALAWSGQRPRSPAGYLHLIRAHDWSTFREALRDWGGPTLNFVYADAAGHIGYQMAGRIPIREGASPRTPVPGWEPGHEWIGEVPFDALPRVFDPPEGVLVTANARITGPGYPYHLAARWGDLPFRAERIQTLLAAKERLSLDDVAAIQLDVHQPEMAEVVRWANLADAADPRVAEVQRALAGWNGDAAPDSVPAALAEAFRLELLSELFAPRLSAALFRDWLGYWWAVHFLALQRAMGAEHVAFFGGDAASAARARAAAATRAVLRAVARLEGLLGPDRDEWRWGRLHTITFLHPLGANPGLRDRLLGLYLNRGPYPAPGSAFTVNNGWWRAAAPFALINGAIYRQIVDLGDLGRSRWAPPPPGQAEQPMSSHYGDLIAPWLAGEYSPMSWDRGDVEAAGEATLRLVPPGA
jgi:penicillin amidase